jgi:hypothetical protein
MPSMLNSRRSPDQRVHEQDINAEVDQLTRRVLPITRAPVIATAVAMNSRYRRSGRGGFRKAGVDRLGRADEKHRRLAGAYAG